MPRSAAQNRLLSGSPFLLATERGAATPSLSSHYTQQAEASQDALGRAPAGVAIFRRRLDTRHAPRRFCFATTQPLPDAELEKLQAEEAAARRRICEGLCGPTLAPLLQDACARVSTHLDAAATGCESLLEATEGRLRAISEANFIQRDCVIAATAPFALIEEGLNCLTPQTPPPEPPAPEPEKPDGFISIDNKFDVFVCTNV